jgi:hypothetical protein
MIQANELRIGNWIYIDNGEKSKYEYEVTAHDIEEIADNGIDCFPIPITPERLEKCGFDSENYFFIVDLFGNKASLCYDFGDRTLGIVVNSKSAFWMPCEHLHNLQNMVFAFINKELNYTP